MGRLEDHQDAYGHAIRDLHHGRQVQVSAKAWRNPVLKNRRVLTAFEPLDDEPVRVDIREDLLTGVAGLFDSTAAETRYLTEERIAHLQRALAARLGALCFYRTNYWELGADDEFSPARCGNVFHVDAPQPSARRAFEELLAEPDRANLRHFPDLYGYLLDGRIVSWANVVDLEVDRSGVGNVYTREASRGRCFGTVVSSACVQSILARNRTPVCSTERSNEPMNRICMRLGFHKVAEDFDVLLAAGP